MIRRKRGAKKYAFADPSKSVLTIPLNESGQDTHKPPRIRECVEKRSRVGTRHQSGSARLELRNQAVRDNAVGIRNCECETCAFTTQNKLALQTPPRRPSELVESTRIPSGLQEHSFCFYKDRGPRWITSTG